MIARQFFTITLALIGSSIVYGQTVAPLWEDFVQAKQNGTTSVIPDFSYAGYHFSKRPIPDVSKRRHFDVTDFGAIPDDNKYDDEGIQAAIRAAEHAPEGGVVFFPPGRFLICPDEDRDKFISVSKSNIVLKGSGSGSGGTEIFQDKMRIGTKQFQFKPDSTRGIPITTITRDAPRESFWIEVAGTDRLEVGQDIVIRHQSEIFTRSYFSPLELSPAWTNSSPGNHNLRLQYPV